MRTKKDYDRQNAYNKEQYDRIGLMLPKGMKPLLQGIAKREGTSLNDIIKRSIQNYVAEYWNVTPNVSPKDNEPSTSALAEPQTEPKKAK